MENRDFAKVFVGNRTSLDKELRMVADHPEIGAVILECTNMTPYARGAAGNWPPGFEIITL